MKSTDNPCLSVTKLKRRGWTESLIRRFLGEPDEEKTNPRFACAAPMRLYRIQRVEEIENSSEFKGEQAKGEKRRIAAKQALATKQKRIQAYVDSVLIEVPRLGKEELIKGACDHFNIGRYEDIRASQESDSAFLERICVNYLRHELTEYETHLGKIAGKVGASGAYLDIKAKVLLAIAEEYDWLSSECYRQEDKARKDEEERELAKEYARNSFY